MNLVVVEGRYTKSDGLYFDLKYDASGELLFTYKNETQRATMLPNGFQIQWEYGTALFTPTSCSCLLENGIHKFVNNAVLTNPQLQVFSAIGVHIAHNIVDKSLVTEALQSPSIQQILLNARNANSLHYSGYSDDPIIQKIVEKAWPMVRNLVGDIPVSRSAQVAVVLPGGERLRPRDVGNDYHIDGLHTPTNGVPENSIQSFDLLVGVSLTDVTNPNMGNFCYIPGSHRNVNESILKMGTEKAREILCLPGTTNGNVNNSMRELVSVGDLACPQPILCEAGSIYLAHYQTIHFVQPNSIGLSPRIALYYRIHGNTSYIQQNDAAGFLHANLVSKLNK